jgi:hypothetical protein
MGATNIAADNQYTAPSAYAGVSAMVPDLPDYARNHETKHLYESLAKQREALPIHPPT